MIYQYHQGMSPDELDQASELHGTDCGDEQLTRQEFKDEADINNILSKFGVMAGERQMTWGQEIDYNLDLQQALQLVSDAKRAEDHIPPELREKYPTWRHMVYGIETGQYQMDLSNLKQKQKLAESSSEHPTS